VKNRQIGAQRNIGVSRGCTAFSYQSYGASRAIWDLLPDTGERSSP